MPDSEILQRESAVRTAASSALMITAVVAVGLNLRPALAAIGPVLDRIEAASGLTSTGAGLLTTIPVFLMGLGALTASSLQRWIGGRRGIVLGLVIIALACIARFFWSSGVGLLASATASGIGIAAVQSLMPGFIKRVFQRDAGRVIGLYSTGIMGGATLAAATAAGLSRELGWEAMLALWGLPAILALVLWQASSPSDTYRQGTASSDVNTTPIWRSCRAWLLLVFFGVGTGAYTLVLAWLPPFYVQLGSNEDTAGYLLAGLTLVEVVAGLIVSGVINRFPDRRGPLAAALLAVLAGLLCLIVMPLALALTAMILLGLGIGALFPLSLIVTLDHADEPAFAGRLAAFVQGGGYMIASIMPFAAGWLRSHSDDLSQAWIMMAAGIMLLLLLALWFSPGKRIL
ncbi:CP family cyanate transporter-like MFS transporter [Agrobacterium tumefaciens]|uniref:CP family cyanate transporter-like MFS transporter n=2 Tax=Agrobacterium radiobacter TaxID=362 RepID=A0ABR6JCN2_AGRRD|nr:CP family cyanate transporter-like MFS transporter [Agrobacterium radiobacter]